MFGSQRRLCPRELSLVLRHLLGRGGRIHLILHGILLGSVTEDDKHVPPD
jgi:hypothetical protein